MSLVEFKFVCANGHIFESPDASGEYGEFVMRGERSPDPALLQAFGDPAYVEVEEILRQLGAFRRKTEFQQADLLQAVFGIACDFAPDGTRLRIGRRAPCPDCGTREMASWEPVGRFSGEPIPVKHSEWYALAKSKKRTLIGNAVKDETNRR